MSRWVHEPNNAQHNEFMLDFLNRNRKRKAEIIRQKMVKKNAREAELKKQEEAD